MLHEVSSWRKPRLNSGRLDATPAGTAVATPPDGTTLAVARRPPSVSAPRYGPHAAARPAHRQREARQRPSPPLESVGVRSADGATAHRAGRRQGGLVLRAGRGGLRSRGPRDEWVAGEHLVAWLGTQRRWSTASCWCPPSRLLVDHHDVPGTVRSLCSPALPVAPSCSVTRWITMVVSPPSWMIQSSPMVPSS